EAKPADHYVRSPVRTQPIINGDVGLLRSAIEHVVRNAIRFTQRDTTVCITLEVTETAAIITVEDHGPGIPDSELKRVFEPFYRVTASRDRDSGGTGLGLAISAHAVKLHRGEIHAVNKPA